LWPLQPAASTCGPSPRPPRPVRSDGSLSRRSVITSEPIIRWIGGKRRLADRLIRLFPRHRCYVEPFAGGAAVFFSKQPSDVEVLNDVNGDLVNLYRVVQHHLEEFVRQFKWALTSRQVFEWLKQTPSTTLTDIQRAARFYYLQQTCFGGLGQYFGTSAAARPTLNLLRLEETLSVAHLRLASVFIEQLHWSECVDRYDRSETLFYMDPPYWQTEGYGVPFGFSEYTRLAAAMRSMKGKTVLSINDHPDIRRAFEGFTVEEVDITYTVGGTTGGIDRSADRRELVYFSWDRRPDDGGLFG